MQFNWPIVGHRQIKEYFTKSLSAGRVHHGYLFEGPAQVGKTTFARMLGKTLMCTGGEHSLKPCGQCRACMAFDQGSHPDYSALTLGEESSISIAKTREFITALATRPLLSEVKVGIIEKAEKLTAEAANALLKTLEEPAKHVVLFVISDQPLMATIVSRCQVIKFGFVSDQDIVGMLRESNAAPEIINWSQGRPGLALELARQGQWSEYRKNAEETLAILGRKESERFLWAIDALQGVTALPIRRQLAYERIGDIERVLRACLLVGSGVEGVKLDAVGKDTVSALANKIGMPKIAGMLERIPECRKFLSANVDPRFVLENLLLD